MYHREQNIQIIKLFKNYKKKKEVEEFPIINKHEMYASGPFV